MGLPAEQDLSIVFIVVQLLAIPVEQLVLVCTYMNPGVIVFV